MPVPPRCLATVVASVPEEPKRGELTAAFATEEVLARDRAWHDRMSRPDVEYVSVVEELSTFALRCTCGSDAGKLLGVRTNDVYVPPVCFACSACNKSVEIFDETVDGWNGETDRKRRRRKKLPSTFALRCASCKGTAWHPAVVVTYQGEASSYLAAGGDRWQDFFDVFAVGGTCVKCGTVSVAASFECA